VRRAQAFAAQQQMQPGECRGGQPYPKLTSRKRQPRAEQDTDTGIPLSAALCPACPFLSAALLSSPLHVTQRR